MLTPKQSQLLASLDPEVLAILDLTPVPSQEFKTNQAIAARVEGWITEASLRRPEPRRIHRDRLPWEEPDLKSLGPNPF